MVRRHTPDEQALGSALAKLQGAVRDLQVADGTQLAQSVKKVKALVVVVEERLAAIPGEVDAALDALGVYTVAETNALVASPGNISPADVNASGVIYTPHGRANPVVTSYVSAYLNSDGRIGATPSRRDMKDHITEYEVPAEAWDLRPVVFTYKDDPLQTPRLGFYAEDADDVDPLLAVHEEGEPYSLHDRALIAALWGMVRDLNGRVAALEGQSQ